MDKEARTSKIKQWVDDHFANKVYSKATKSAICSGIKDFLYQEGYRKPPEGKPPLLSDEAFEKWCWEHRKYVNGICNKSESCAICGRKVQREADIKWYEALL